MTTKKFFEVLKSAVRSVTNTVRLDGIRGKFCHLIVDLTTVPGVDTVTVTIQGRDPVSGKLYTILASAALSAQATTVLKVGPGLPVAANLSANDVLPDDIQITFTHSAGTNFTYSAGLHVMD